MKLAAVVEILKIIITSQKDLSFIIRKSNSISPLPEIYKNKTWNFYVNKLNIRKYINFETLTLLSVSVRINPFSYYSVTTTKNHVKLITLFFCGILDSIPFFRGRCCCCCCSFPITYIKKQWKPKNTTEKLLYFFICLTTKQIIFFPSWNSVLLHHKLLFFLSQTNSSPHSTADNPQTHPSLRFFFAFPSPSLTIPE